MRKKDLTGMKLGRLLVLEECKERKGRQFLWKCLCDCGKNKISSSNALRKNVRSCGCLGIESRFITNEDKGCEIGLVTAKSLYSVYKVQSKIRKLDFYLSIEEFLELTKKNCFYCNRPPSNIKKGKGKNANYTYNGIDRVDNNIGYKKENCVSCCKFCNLAKNDGTLEDFKKWAEMIYINSLEKFTSFTYPC